MSRRWWRISDARITEDEVNRRVAIARADIAAVLAEVLDDDAGLARIYALHGQQAPPSASETAPDEDDNDDESGQVQVVCGETVEEAIDVHRIFAVRAAALEHRGHAEVGTLGKGFGARIRVRKALHVAHSN